MKNTMTTERVVMELSRVQPAKEGEPTWHLRIELDGGETLAELRFGDADLGRMLATRRVDATMLRSEG